jgi:hypothetical protein
MGSRVERITAGRKIHGSDLAHLKMTKNRIVPFWGLSYDRQKLISTTYCDPNEEYSPPEGLLAQFSKGQYHRRTIKRMVFHCLSPINTYFFSPLQKIDYELNPIEQFKSTV